jgi:outer membrane protein assembly factor BamE (lipoprotein component of BamABCDE complex)
MKLLIFFFIFSFLIQSCSSPTIGPSDSELEKMTRSEKWACLEKGMSEETVLRILGKPSSKKSWSGQTSYKFECFLCKATISENGKLWAWHGPEEMLN